MELHDIITRIREGETAEFARLVARYRDMAFGYALTLLDQEQMAEDAVQEALLIAYTHLDRLRQPQAFGAWLRAIVRHRCSRALRAGPPTVSWEQMEERSSGDAVDPAHEALMNAVREQVRVAIAELPVAQQKVLQLYYEAGLSQQEIAARLSLTAPTVNMRLHAARTRLRRRLQIMTETTHEAGNPGRVQEAHGLVVTIQFAPGAIPSLFSRLTADGTEILCVVQHLSAGRVRAIATRAAAVWTPGQEIIDTGQPFTDALDQTTIQQAIDVLRVKVGNEDEFAIQNLKSKIQNHEIVPLPSGIKTIEVFAPLIQDGSAGIFTEWGLGVLVLLPELLRHLDREENRQTFLVFLPSIRDAAHWREVTAEITAGSRNIAIIYLPVADPIAQKFVDSVQNLDTILVLARRLAELAIWPCLDPLLCRSPHLDDAAAGAERATVTAEVRQLLTRYFTLQFALSVEARHALSQQEQLAIQRARKALRFLSQPFYVAEPYTNRPGVSVTSEEALRGFSDIMSGRFDTASKDSFYMIGAAPTT